MFLKLTKDSLTGEHPLYYTLTHVFTGICFSQWCNWAVFGTVMSKASLLCIVQAPRAALVVSGKQKSTSFNAKSPLTFNKSFCWQRDRNTALGHSHFCLSFGREKFIISYKCYLSVKMPLSYLHTRLSLSTYIALPSSAFSGCVSPEIWLIPSHQGQLHPKGHYIFSNEISVSKPGQVCSKWHQLIPFKNCESNFL